MLRRGSPLRLDTWSSTALACALVACSAFDDPEPNAAATREQRAEACPPPEGALSGDPCGFGAAAGDCGGSLCGACGSGNRCESAFFACDASGTLRVARVTQLDCPDLGSPAGAAVWDDCEAALDGAAMIDTCEGIWACARRREDPCCLEVAACAPEFDLVHLEVCAEGCERIEPRDDLRMADSCNSAFQGMLLAGQPCEGEFMCIGTVELSLLSDHDDLFGPLIWCGGGIVQVAADVLSSPDI